MNEKPQDHTRIRQAEKQDYPQMLTIWMQSVSATHHFLSPEDFDAIYMALANVYFPAVEALWVYEENGSIAAFIGLNPPKVEMLFVSPSSMRKGIGRRLLDHFRTTIPDMQVDVNEQNALACRFYQQYGFRQTGRSEIDGEGRAYPLLHLQLVA